MNGEWTYPGHTIVTHSAQEPTCTEPGWEEYYTCEQCPDYTTYAEIPAKGHTAVTDPAVPATCTETGLTEGSHCSECGEIIVAQEVVPALGHSYTSEVTKEATYSEDGTVTYTCSHCGDTYTETIPALALANVSASLSLNDNIDVNFYVTNIDEDADLSKISVRYIFGGTETEGTVNNRTSNHFVVASCSAKQIGDSVTFELYYDGVLVAEVPYSVRAYCERTIENTSSSDKLIALCKAALDYGAYAQIHFGYNTDNLANATYSAGTVPDTVIPAEYNAQSVNGTGAGIKQMAMTLSLESRTEINVYFLPLDGAELSDYTVMIKRGDAENSEWEDVTEEVAFTPATGAYMLTVSGIAAKDLDKAQLISVTYGGETTTITYSPLTWACRQQGNSDGNTANLAKALYRYWLGATAYLG
jgi:hypothetical protein